jgi:hypothetical protein
MLTRTHQTPGRSWPIDATLFMSRSAIGARPGPQIKIKSEVDLAANIGRDENSGEETSAFRISMANHRKGITGEIEVNDTQGCLWS